jgi:putative PIN family toxin of toxin-antitoxin system
MKVILDANIYISFLLTASEKQTVRRIVRACFLEFEHIQLLVPSELIDELLENVQNKEYLREHIPLAELAQLIGQLHLVAEVLSPVVEDIPAYASDPDDDYLIVHGLAAHVDYLVTGDRRLRSLDKVDSLHIVTPAEFIVILQAQNLIG